MVCARLESANVLGVELDENDEARRTRWLSRFERPVGDRDSLLFRSGRRRDVRSGRWLCQRVAGRVGAGEGQPAPVGAVISSMESPASPNAGTGWA